MKRNATLLVLAAALLVSVITGVAIGPVWIAPQKIAAMLSNLVVPTNHTWSEAEAIIVLSDTPPTNLHGAPRGIWSRRRRRRDAGPF